MDSTDEKRRMYDTIMENANDKCQIHRRQSKIKTMKKFLFEIRMFSHLNLINQKKIDFVLEMNNN